MGMHPPLAGTPHGLEEYAPRPYRRGVALCLSGGGFRAALFHLGALRRLNELGILRRLRTISAVSGGSTIAAHLAATWPVWRRGCPTDEWEREVSAPFRRFTSSNLSVRAAIIGWWPTNLTNNAGIEALADACDALCPMPLQGLPKRPNFIFCTTDLVSASPVFLDRASDRPWRVGKAVAIWSCLPPVFRPYIESNPRYIALVDGGVADNRGVEPIWQRHDTLLVSDGGDVLRPQWNFSISWGIKRSIDVLDARAELTQKRWLLALFMRRVLRGAYWGLSSSTWHFEQQQPALLVPGAARRYIGYSPSLARDVLANMRLDYDEFSDAEAAVLENHGYLLADAAARTHVPRLVQRDTPLLVPHPGWLSDSKVTTALRDSSRKLFFGRGALRAIVRGAPGAVPESIVTAAPPPDASPASQTPMESAAAIARA